MSALTRITIKHDSLDNAQSVSNELYADAGDLLGLSQGLINFLSGLQGGARQARVDLQVEDLTAGDRAAGTIVIDSHANVTSGTDTTTIGTVTLTWEASPVDENDVDVGADAAGDADNLAAAINAHSILSQVVSAVSDGVDTVTVTSLFPGVIGEQLTLAVSDATAQSVTAMTGVTATLQSARRAYEFGET